MKAWPGRFVWTSVLQRRICLQMPEMQPGLSDCRSFAAAAGALAVEGQLHLDPTAGISLSETSETSKARAWGQLPYRNELQSTDAQKHENAWLSRAGQRVDERT